MSGLRLVDALVLFDLRQMRRLLSRASIPRKTRHRNDLVQNFVEYAAGSHEAVNLIGGTVNAIADILQDLATALLIFVTVFGMGAVLWILRSEK